MKQVQYFDHQYSRSLVHFYLKKHFPAHLDSGHITGEASPGYLVYASVPARIQSSLPEVKSSDTFVGNPSCKLPVFGYSVYRFFTYVVLQPVLFLFSFFLFTFLGVFIVCFCAQLAIYARCG